MGEVHPHVEGPNTSLQSPILGSLMPYCGTEYFGIKAILLPSLVNDKFFYCSLSSKYNEDLLITLQALVEFPT